MPYPTWSAGQRVTAAALTAAQPLTSYKAGDTPRPSTTTLAADPELSLAVEANAVYVIDCWLQFTATAGADIKIAWASPSGATMSYAALGTGAANFTDHDASVVPGGTARAARGNGSTAQSLNSRGRLATGSTAGTLQLQWAQNASNAAATTLLAGSWIRLRRVA